MTKPHFCDIFCTVIDNFGDIGICWRLASDMASRGLQVRLWVDDSSALQWMALQGTVGVQVLPWQKPLDVSAGRVDENPTSLLIEAFGCEPAPEFIASCVSIYSATGAKPVWINLEYLTAESYAERNHALPSPINNGPAAGWIKYFFYPGFIPQTGGLLRELDLVQRQQVFDRDGWLRSQGIHKHDAVLVSLFCYEPEVLAHWLDQLAQQGIQGKSVHLLVTAGRAQRAIEAVQAVKAVKAAEAILQSKKRQNIDENWIKSNEYMDSMLSISHLPLLTQTEFDHLLWACDINFVRGEDSIVRAIWAGKPFVWQIYPQDDGAHSAKLDAFLDMLDATPSLRSFHNCWNADQAQIADSKKLANSMDIDLPAWQQTVCKARAKLMAQDDLTTSLLQFMEKNR